jgi:hypothetical protein
MTESAISRRRRCPQKGRRRCRFGLPICCLACLVEGNSGVFLGRALVTPRRRAHPVAFYLQFGGKRGGHCCWSRVEPLAAISSKRSVMRQRASGVWRSSLTLRRISRPRRAPRRDSSDRPGSGCFPLGRWSESSSRTAVIDGNSQPPTCDWLDGCRPLRSGQHRWDSPDARGSTAGDAALSGSSNPVGRQGNRAVPER